MKIHKVNLQNFRSFEQAEFILHPKLNVLAGVNASGKSTVLEAIELLLGRLTREGEGYNTLPEIGEFDVTIGKKNEECLLSIDIDAGLVNEEFTDDKGFVSYGMGVRQEGQYLSPIVEFSLELRKRIKENTELPVLLSFMLGKEKESSIYTGKVLNPIYQNAWNCSVQNEKEFVIWFEKNESVENAIRLNENIEYRLPLLENVRTSITKFMEHIGEFENPPSNFRARRLIYHNEDASSTYISFLNLHKGDKVFDFSQLSSGEKSLLVLVSEIARRASMTNRKGDALSCSGIVLIDEIDLHLHPRWQRNILQALCSTFPNIQFIVTTHSPQVLASVSRDSVFILNGAKVFRPSTDSLGVDSNTILEEIMQASKMPLGAEEILDGIFDILASKDWKNAEKAIANIELSKLSAEHPELVRAKAILERKKILSEQ